MKIKVLLATPLYPPDSGGPATDAALLNKLLPHHNIDVEVYSFGSVRRFPKGIRHIIYAVGLWKRSRGIDCIVAMDTFSVCLPAACIAKLTRTLLVVRVPGDFAWEQATQRFGVTDSIEVFQHKKYGFKVELLRTLQKFSMRRADLSVACSDFLKNIVATWGVDPKKLIRIYLGIDFNEISSAPKHPPGGKNIFSLGRFVPWKGFSMLIEMLRELPEEWNLVIAGDGPLRSSLEHQAHQLGISQRVIFTGVISRAEVFGWLRHADAFVLNTSFESFSFQVLEAMESGTPVITTAIGSIPELMRNGIDGILCTPNDKESFKRAVLSTISEPEVWSQRTQSAKTRALTFSTERSVGLFAEELKKLCA